MDINDIIKSDKPIKDIINETCNGKKLLESSLSRIWQHINKGEPFALLSLSRGGMPDEKKAIAYSELKSHVRDLGYGYIETKGGYIEQDSGKVFEEESLFVPEITKEAAIKLGQIDKGYGPQDSVLYGDGKGFVGYIITNPEVGTVGSVTTKFNITDPKQYFTFAKEAVKEYYSKLIKGSHRNKRFSFIPESFRLYEMGDRRTRKYRDKDWWYNFGRRVDF